MAMTPDDVLKLIKDKEVKFVDLRFTDTRGKEQHVTVPVKYYGKDKFELGHAFDGSSIAGWKGIQASDMLLMPDASSASRCLRRRHRACRRSSAQSAYCQPGPALVPRPASRRLPCWLPRE